MTNYGQHIEGRADWLGSELLEQPDWSIELTDAHRRELEAAVSAESFALPELSVTLRTVQRTLEHGCGVAVLRGVHLTHADPVRLETAFRGIAAHVGTAVSQSADGDTLLHVRDEAFGDDDPRVRGPHTNKELAFHTDRCDVIAFHCVRPAREGGVSHVLSSLRLYNDLLRDEPAVVEALNGLFPYLRHTVDGGNERPFTLLPVFTVHEGRFAGSLLRVLIDRANTSPLAPDLTAEQLHALDRVAAVAEDPARYAEFRLEAGDVLFLNNWVTFHRRTAFVDDPDPARRRHLMRLWLSVPNSRPLDPRFADHFGATAPGAIRGGMRPAR